MPSQFDESLLTAYLDNELSSDERALVEQHLAESPEARSVFEDLKRVRGIVSTLSKWDGTPLVFDASRMHSTANDSDSYGNEAIDDDDQENLDDDSSDFGLKNDAFVSQAINGANSVANNEQESRQKTIARSDSAAARGNVRWTKWLSFAAGLIITVLTVPYLFRNSETVSMAPGGGGAATSESVITGKPLEFQTQELQQRMNTMQQEAPSPSMLPPGPASASPMSAPVVQTVQDKWQVPSPEATLANGVELSGRAEKSLDSMGTSVQLDMQSAQAATRTFDAKAGIAVGDSMSPDTRAKSVPRFGDQDRQLEDFSSAVAGQASPLALPTAPAPSPNNLSLSDASPAQSNFAMGGLSGGSVSEANQSSNKSKELSSDFKDISPLRSEIAKELKSSDFEPQAIDPLAAQQKTDGLGDGELRLAKPSSGAIAAKDETAPDATGKKFFKEQQLREADGTKMNAPIPAGADTTDPSLLFRCARTEAWSEEEVRSALPSIASYVPKSMSPALLNTNVQSGANEQSSNLKNTNSNNVPVGIAALPNDSSTAVWFSKLEALEPIKSVEFSEGYFSRPERYLRSNESYNLAPSVQTPSVQTPGIQAPSVQTPSIQTPSIETLEARTLDESKLTKEFEPPSQSQRAATEEQLKQKKLEVTQGSLILFLTVKEAREVLQTLHSVREDARETLDFGTVQGPATRFQSSPQEGVVERTPRSALSEDESIKSERVDAPAAEPKNRNADSSLGTKLQDEAGVQSQTRERIAASKSGELPPAWWIRGGNLSRSVPSPGSQSIDDQKVILILNQSGSSR